MRHDERTTAPPDEPRVTGRDEPPAPTPAGMWPGETHGEVPAASPVVARLGETHGEVPVASPVGTRRGKTHGEVPVAVPVGAWRGETAGRDEVLAVVLQAARAAGAAVFTGNGDVARAVAAVGDHPLNFSMFGSMGLAPVLAAGFAARTGRPVVAVEGDGNALMGLSGLPVTAFAAGTPFVHVVLDNGVYETTGGQPTLAARVDLPAMALAAGYATAGRPGGPGELRDVLDGGLRAPGPSFVLVRTRLATGARHPRVAAHPRDIARRFKAAAGTDDTTTR
ncbi:thiamine pyrophosphate-dependent enzyme [Sphaerisporangium sp. B11E5]|uniref:thiamine pyrophosphate-dependent enzyme n=1 Tax=Sphaerisporangium sp. B11E5 TaxID=3153563 RepID=UPI00325EAF70